MGDKIRFFKPVDIKMLLILADCKGYREVDLAKKLNMKESNLNKWVSNLEKDGVITKVCYKIRRKGEKKRYKEREMGKKLYIREDLQIWHEIVMNVLFNLKKPQMFRYFGSNDDLKRANGPANSSYDAEEIWFTFMDGFLESEYTKRIIGKYGLIAVSSLLEPYLGSSGIQSFVRKAIDSGIATVEDELFFDHPEELYPDFEIDRIGKEIAELEKYVAELDQKIIEMEKLKEERKKKISVLREKLESEVLYKMYVEYEQSSQNPTRSE